MAKRHPFYLSDGGAGKTGEAGNCTGTWRHLDGGSPGAFPTIVELDSSNAPGWYYFEADIDQRTVVELVCSTALAGDSGVRTMVLEPEDDLPQVIYTPWYQPRFRYRDDPGLSGANRPIATIQRIGDSKYFTGSAWQVGAATVEMPELGTATGIYEYVIPYANVSDDDGRFNGHDGYRVSIEGDQGKRYLIVYPTDPGYDVWASAHRGGAIPVLPMTGDGLRVMHQRIQWDRSLGGAAGATVKATIRRVSDGKCWSTTSGGEWLTAGTQTDPTLSAITGFDGLYELTIAEADLDRELGREGYDVLTYDTGLQVDHLVRYMPTGGFDDERTNHGVTGSIGMLLQLVLARLLYWRMLTANPDGDKLGDATIGLYASQADLDADTNRLDTVSADFTYNSSTGVIETGREELST